MGSAGMSGVLCQSRIDGNSWTISSLLVVRSFRAGGFPPSRLLWRKPRGSRIQGGTAGIARGAMDEDEGGPRKDQETPKVDWDKAWTNFSVPEKKKPFLNFDMEKYVSRRPEHSNYPLSEEVDPLRKTERSALGFWSSPRLFYVLIGLVVVLFIYMVIIVGPPPSR